MSNRFAEDDFNRRYGAEVSGGPESCAETARWEAAKDATRPLKDQPALTEREAEILKVAIAAYHVKGMQEQIIVTRLKMSVTTFWQIVNDLIDTERGLAFDPVNVNRLRRQRNLRVRH